VGSARRATVQCPAHCRRHKGFHSLWLPENESRVPVDLPVLFIAGTDDPVGARTITIQNLITR